MPHILKRIAGAAVSAVILAVLFFFWLIPLCAVAQDSILPFYRVSVDIQKPQEQFFIDRTFYGNQAFLAFDIFDGNDAQEQPLAWTNTANWTFNVSYAYDQYETGKYYIAQSSISSNRVYFLGATNLWFSPRDNYFVELIGTHASGYVKTFGQGFMNQDFSPGADSNVTVQMGAYNLTWWTNNVGQLAASNAARIAAIETSQWTTIRTILTNTTWSATIVTQQLVLQIVTNAPGIALTIGGGLLSSTNTSMGTVIDVTLTTNAVQIAMSGLFLTYTQGFGGDVTGPFSNMQIAAGVISTNELDTNVNARLSEASATFAWGSWSQGIYGAVASDLYLGSNGYPQIRTGAVTTVEILNGTVAAVDMATNVGVSTFLNDSGYLTTSAAQIVFFPTNGALGGSVYGTPTNVLLRTNSVGSAQVTDGTLTTDDVALAGFDARYLNTAQMRTNSGGLWMSNNIYFIRGPSASPGSFNIYFFEAGYTSFVNSAQGQLYVGGNLGQGLLWGSGNDGSGSTLDADLIDGMDSTNFPLSSAIWPVVSNLVLYSVSTTSDQPHRVKTDFVVGDSLWSATNLWLGSTNGVMSTNMLVNGNFTGDTAWVMTGGAAWNAGSTGILTCSAGTTGSAIQSNRFGATPGTWVFRYVCLVPPATGSLVASFGGDSFYQTGNLTGRVEYVFTPDTTDTFSFTMNSTNGLISVDEFELFHLHTGDGGVGGNWSVGGKLSASNGVFSGTISGNATGYLPLVEGGEVLGGVTLHALDIRDTTFTLYDSYPSENTVFEQNGVDLWLTQSGQIYQNATNLVWHAGNDGSGSGLDADLLDGKSSTGFVSNLPGVALPAMDAGALTNLPPSTSTNSVSGIKVSEATNVYVGTVALNSSATIQFSATATGPTASVLSGALTGLPGGGVTGVLNAGILTGSVPLAALGNVAQTGQVNQATNLPQAAAIKVLATSDGGTTTYYKADDTGTIAFTNAPLAASAMVVASTDGGTSLFLKAEALASSNIVTISSWPIYAAETWTAQYSVIEAFDIFDTATPLTQFGGLIDGGTATVDLINFAPGATTWTTNSTMLLVGVTSIVPSAALSASNHLGIQIRPGATVTNEMRLFVRGWR